MGLVNHKGRIGGLNDLREYQDYDEYQDEVNLGNGGNILMWKSKNGRLSSSIASTIVYNV